MGQLFLTVHNIISSTIITYNSYIIGAFGKVYKGVMKANATSITADGRGVENNIEKEVAVKTLKGASMHILSTLTVWCVYIMTVCYF